MQQTTPTTRQVAYQELARESTQSDQSLVGGARGVLQPASTETIQSFDSTPGATDTLSSRPEPAPGLPKSAWVSDGDVHCSSSSESDCSMDVNTVHCLNDAPQVKLVSSSASLHDRVGSGRWSLSHVGEPLHVEEVELFSHDGSSFATDQSHDLSHDQGVSLEASPHVSLSEGGSQQRGGANDDDSVVLLPATSENLSVASSTSGPCQCADKIMSLLFECYL